MDLTLAILWTTGLIADFALFTAGLAPSWTLVFCPLVCLVADRWEHYFSNK